MKEKEIKIIFDVYCNFIHCFGENYYAYQKDIDKCIESRKKDELIALRRNKESGYSERRRV